MPIDRLFHPRAGHSMKVTGLTDLEFRVWWTVIVSADDFGLMRCSAVTVQAANDALAQQPRKRIDLALQRLIDVGLLLAFTHQERRYVCNPEWQIYQHVEYPKQTINPIPPADTLALCKPETQELFRQCFGTPSQKFRVKAPGTSQKDSGKFSEDSRKFSEDSPSGSRAREEANAKAKANGKGLAAPGEAAELGSPAERVLDAFRLHWKRAYGHECSVLISHLRHMQLEQQLAAHSEVTLMQALAAYFVTDDDYVKRQKHPLAVFLGDPLKYLAKVTAASPRDPVAETQADAEAVREILRQQDRAYGAVPR